jgi:hypothetical protein
VLLPPSPILYPLFLIMASVFFFAHHLQQKKREATVAPHPNNDRCQCKKCAGNPVQLIHEQIAPTRMLGLEDDVVSEANAVSPKKKRRAKERNEEIVSEASIIPAVASSLQYLPQNANMPELGYARPLPYYPYCGPAAFPAAGFMNPMVPSAFSMMPMMPMMAPHEGNTRKLQAEYCCVPYYRYVTSKKPRVGRPPHDPVNCCKLNNFQY